MTIFFSLMIPVAIILISFGIVETFREIFLKGESDDHS